MDADETPRTTAIHPLFMKTLIECYYLRQEARNKVSHDRQFYKQLLRVFKWQRRIRRDIDNSNSSGNGSNYSDSSPQSSLTSSSSSISTAFIPTNQPDRNKAVEKPDENSKESPPSNNLNRLIKRESQYQSPGDNQSTHVSVGYAQQVPANDKSRIAILNDDHRPSSLSQKATSSKEIVVSTLIGIRNNDDKNNNKIDAASSSSKSNAKMIVNDNKSILQDESPSSGKESAGADLDIMRRNLWLMIVRKDIIQAHRKKVSFRDHKLLKTKTIAYRCQSHFKEFQRLNNKLKQQRESKEYQSLSS